MRQDRGKDVELRLARRYHGSPHSHDAVDFCTDKYLFEVKSCNLFNHCTFNNTWRRGARSSGSSHQYGRFHIKLHNHKAIHDISLREKKKARYIFALVVGKTFVTKIKSWKAVNKVVKTKPQTKEICLRIAEVMR